MLFCLIFKNSHPYRVRTSGYKIYILRQKSYVAKYEIKINFGKLYGEKFAFLGEQKPHSILLAKGSEGAVYRGSKLVQT